MTNHAQEAAEWLEDAPMEHQQGNVERAKLCTAMAQARATLALVEQQRVANLIALAELSTRKFENYSNTAGPFGTIFSYASGLEGDFLVKPEIADVLGITEES